MLANLKKFVAPIGEALVAICRLFGIGTGIVFQPIDEEVAVFLQDQELSEDDISLVKTLGGQLFTQGFPNAS